MEDFENFYLFFFLVAPKLNLIQPHRDAICGGRADLLHQYFIYLFFSLNAN